MQFLITLVFACTTVGSTYDLGSLPQDTFGYSPKAWSIHILHSIHQIFLTVKSVWGKESTHVSVRQKIREIIFLFFFISFFECLKILS